VRRLSVFIEHRPAASGRNQWREHMSYVEFIIIALLFSIFVANAMAHHTQNRHEHLLRQILVQIRDAVEKGKP
jgi:hypothetical protein